ncbi:hypothetical protein [Clostridium sp.]
MKKALKKSKVRYIYEAAVSGTPLKEVFESLKIAVHRINGQLCYV